jgi:hypothetical protein
VRVKSVGFPSWKAPGSSLAHPHHPAPTSGAHQGSTTTSTASPTIHTHEQGNTLRRQTSVPAGVARSNSFPHTPTTARSVSAAFDCPAARFVHPHSLHVRDGALHDGIGPLEQFALECDQKELLALPAEVMARLVATKHINDLRTIFLAHDKRMLAVLSSPILDDYLSPADAALLRAHVVPTFVCGMDAAARAKALANRTQWLLKPNGGGKVCACVCVCV